MCAAGLARLSQSAAHADEHSSSIPIGVVFPNSCSLELAGSAESVAGTATTKQTTHNTTALQQLQRSLSNLVLSPRDSNSMVGQLPPQQAKNLHTSFVLRPMSSSDSSGRNPISGENHCFEVVTCKFNLPRTGLHIQGELHTTFCTTQHL